MAKARCAFVDEHDDGIHIRIPHPRTPTGLGISTSGSDLTIGFRQGHTHGDILTAFAAGSPLDCTIAYVESILTGERTLAISLVDGHFHDAWITDDPDEDRRYSQANERLIVGSWKELASSEW